jgi:hypothetical protein
VFGRRHGQEEEEERDRRNTGLGKDGQGITQALIVIHLL